MEDLYKNMFLSSDLTSQFRNIIIASGGPNDPSVMFTNPNTSPSYELPDRVKPYVRYRVEDGADRKHVHVGQKVRQGDLLFAVAQPLLNIIDDDALAHTCDHCLVTQCAEMSSRYRASSSGVEDMMRDMKVSFLACGGCKVLYYCSKECQKAAWKHHHKFECPTYAHIKKHGGGEMIEKRKTRFILRLLECYNNGIISESEWAEVRALPTNRESKMAMSPFRDVAKAIAESAKMVVETDLTEDDIIDLFCSMHNNQGGIEVPLMKGSRCYDPLLTGSCIIGVDFEPFIACMAHDCVPSAWTIHEGRELRIRATHDMAAGEEITVRYCPEVHDYTIRKHDLETFWVIDCDCALCKKGDFGPKGAMRDRVLALSQIDLTMFPGRLGDVERGIKDLRAAGFGWGAHPMRLLHQQCMRAHLKEGSAIECLKLALKIRYVIEPAQDPPLTLGQRIDTLYILQTLLNFPVPGETSLGDLPLFLKELAMQVNFHLRHMLARDTARYYGKDSAIAMFEKEFANRRSEYFNASIVGAPSGGEQKFKYVPLQGNVSEKKKYVDNMNAMLKWAGLEKLTEKELL